MNAVLKLLTPLISVGAGFLANKVVDSVWKKSTGNAPPKDANDLDQTLRSTLIFALVSAGVGALIQTLVSRGTSEALQRYDATRDKT